MCLTNQTSFSANFTQSHEQVPLPCLCCTTGSSSLPHRGLLTAHTCEQPTYQHVSNACLPCCRPCRGRAEGVSVTCNPAGAAPNSHTSLAASGQDPLWPQHIPSCRRHQRQHTQPGTGRGLRSRCSICLTPRKPSCTQGW